MSLTRRTFGALACASLAVVAAGCAGPTPSDTKKTQSSSNPGGDTKPPAKKGGKFTYWSMWKQGEDQQKVIADEIEKFTASTGISVDVQWSGREVLTQVIPRLNAGNPPDLIDNGSTDFAGKIGLQNMMDLTDLYAMNIPDEAGKKVSDVIPESLMANMKNESGEPFIVPYEIIGSTLFYNAKVTPDLKNPPKTFDDFIKVLDKLKSGGRTPLALDGDILDYCGYWVEWPVLRVGGPGTIVQSAQDPTGKKFLESAWMEGTDATGQLIANGYFPKGFRGTKFPTQQAAWADQTSKTDMVLMGTWLPSEATGSLQKSGGDPASIEFASFPFPSVGDNKGDGLVEAQPVGFGIPAKARNADAAKQFVAWFMNKNRVGRIASEAKNLTPRTDVQPPAELAGYFDEFKNAKTTVLFTDGTPAAEPKWMTDVWQPTLGEFFDGKLNAAQFRQALSTKTITYHKNK